MFHYCRSIRSTHKGKRKSNAIEADHCAEISAQSKKIAMHEGNGTLNDEARPEFVHRISQLREFLKGHVYSFK